MLVTVAGSSLVKVSEDEIDDELRSAVDEVVNALFSSIMTLRVLTLS